MAKKTPKPVTEVQALRTAAVLVSSVMCTTQGFDLPWYLMDATKRVARELVALGYLRKTRTGYDIVYIEQRRADYVADSLARSVTPGANDLRMARDLARKGYMRKVDGAFVATHE